MKLKDYRFMNMSIFDRMRGMKNMTIKKRVTKSYRPGRQYRAQQIVTWENNRLKVKTIIHQMY